MHIESPEPAQRKRAGVSKSSSTASAEIPTAERILDAAEAVFANEGYNAATIRRITQVAGVPLNLARYHHGSKDQLFCQVLARRADETCRQIETELAKATAGPSAPTLEAVVGAVVSLTVDRLSAGDVGWRNYLRLLSNMGALESRPELLAPWRERYTPTDALVRSAMRAAAPHASKAAIDLGTHFLYTLVGHTVLDFSIGRYAVGAPLEDVDWAQLRLHMVTHAVGGLRAQIALDTVSAVAVAAGT